MNVNEALPPWVHDQEDGIERMLVEAHDELVEIIPREAQAARRHVPRKERHGCHNMSSPIKRVSYVIISILASYVKMTTSNVHSRLDVTMISNDLCAASRTSAPQRGGTS